MLKAFENLLSGFPQTEIVMNPQRYKDAKRLLGGHMNLYQELECLTRELINVEDAKKLEVQELNEKIKELRQKIKDVSKELEKSSINKPVRGDYGISGTKVL